MPAFTVSAVDTTANTLTSTGVAATGGAAGTVLQTGDRCRVRNIGGALPAATPALVAGTDYFARRVSDDAIQIYDTNPHAVAGGSTGLVDITGSGSGTTSILFQLPYCIPTRVLAAGSQVRHEDLNAAYNAIVAVYGGTRDVSFRTFFPVLIGASAPAFSVVANPANAAFALVQKSSASTFAFYYVPFNAGDQIVGVAFEGYGDGAVDVTVEMAYAPDSHTALANLGTLTITNAPATWTAYTIPSLTAQLLGAGAVLIGDFKPNAANFHVGPVTVAFAR